MQQRVMSGFWLCSAAIALSIAWLLPNHTPPWTGFHSDAWAAFILIPVVGWVLWPTSELTLRWNLLSAIVVCIILLQLLQYAFGLIAFFGTLWIQSLYMLGFLLAILAGGAWERRSPNECVDFLALAFFIGALFSTLLQIYQWLGLEGAGLWILNVQTASRFYANLAQPNMLGTLLLLGALACVWGCFRRILNLLQTLILAAVLLFGTALTESRTAWLNVALLTCLAFWWVQKSSLSRGKWILIGVLIYFGALIVFLPLLNKVAAIAEYIPVESIAVRGINDGTRLRAWQMLLEALMHKPFFGYGWGQIAWANFEVVNEYPAQQGMFAQSHNLFLDLLLWNGVFIGVLIISVILWWIGKTVLHMSDISRVIMVGFVLILGVHSMLEYPLQYAYFLLPFGLLIGALNERMCFGVSWTINRWTSVVLLGMAAVAYAITVRDYFKVEESFYGLRFEAKKIKTNMPRVPPDVFVLTQFREHIKFARNVPQGGVSSSELEWMRKVVITMPSAQVIYLYAENLALNNESTDSQMWLLRLCKTMPPVNCDAMQMQWEEKSKSIPEMAKVSWPVGH
jgi:hypothetical protein